MPDKTTPTLFELFNEIAIIAQLSRAMFEARLPDGMLLTHFSVLNHLVRLGDGATPLKLAKAFQVPKTSMTHTLSGLEKADFITLKPNQSDGRSKLVFITDDGRAFRQNAIESLGPDLAAIGQEFDIDRLAALLPDLKDLRAYLDAARD